jgi:hypothetical protein
MGMEVFQPGTTTQNCVMCRYKKQIKTNFVALISKRTASTVRPPLVGEVSANFCRYKVSRVRHNGFPRPYSPFSRPELCADREYKINFAIKSVFIFPL